MDKNTKEMAIQAIELRIIFLQKMLNGHKGVLKDAQTSLKNKKDSSMPVGPFSATVAYNETYAEEKARTMPEKIEKTERIIKNYQDAKEDLLKNY